MTSRQMTYACRTSSRASSCVEQLHVLEFIRRYNLSLRGSCQNVRKIQTHTSTCTRIIRFIRSSLAFGTIPGILTGWKNISGKPNYRTIRSCVTSDCNVLPVSLLVHCYICHSVARFSSNDPLSWTGSIKVKHICSGDLASKQISGQ